MSDSGKKDNEEDFGSMSPAKRTVVRIVSAIIFIIMIWGVVALSDKIIGMFNF